MHGLGIGIARAVRKFIRQGVDFALTDSFEPLEAELDVAWVDPDYHLTMKALLGTGHFRVYGERAEDVADAYLCGVHRGVRTAIWEIRRRELAEEKAQQRKKAKAKAGKA
jgi:hypothetical protein